MRLALLALLLASCTQAKLNQELYCRLHMTQVHDKLEELSRQVLKGEVKIKTVFDLEDEVNIIDKCLRAHEGVY